MNRCQPKRVSVNQLNQHLTCALCSGYFIDATTIVECLHSFCRSCLLRYFETTNKCPICDIEINEFQLDKSIRFDRTLQMLVYKLIPGLYKSEFQRRKEYCLEHCDTSESENSSSPKSAVLTATQLFSGLFFDSGLIELASRVFAPDDTIVFSLECSPPTDDAKMDPLKSNSHCDIQKQMSLKRYFRCPAAVKVLQLKKLLANKFDSAFVAFQVDIIYGGNLLPEDWALMDVATVYAWDRKSALKLHFNLFKLEVEEEPMPKLEIQVDGSSSTAQPLTATTTTADQVAKAKDDKGEHVASKFEIPTNIATASSSTISNSSPGPNCNINRLLSVDKLIGKDINNNNDAKNNNIQTTYVKQHADIPIKNAPVNESILDDVIRVAMLSADDIKRSSPPSPSVSLFDKQAMLLINRENGGKSVKNGCHRQYKPGKSKKSLTSVVQQLSNHQDGVQLVPSGIDCPPAKPPKKRKSTDDGVPPTTKKPKKEHKIANVNTVIFNNTVSTTNIINGNSAEPPEIVPKNIAADFEQSNFKQLKAENKEKATNNNAILTIDTNHCDGNIKTSSIVFADKISEANLINVVDMVAEGKESSLSTTTMSHHDSQAFLQQQQQQQQQSQQQQLQTCSNSLLFCI